MRPRWVLFDLNGTLLDPVPVGEAAGLGPRGGEAALDAAVLGAMADSLSGEYRPLPELLRAALERETKRVGAGAAGLDEAMERAAGMPPFPGAGEALERLRGAGMHTGVLTNSSRAAAVAALEAAGLRDLVEVVVGSDAVGVYKPHRRVYEAGVDATAAAAHEVCLVAAHWWDVLGAARAGLRTAWLAHKEHQLMPGVEVDWRAEDLRALGARLGSDR